MIKSEDNVMTFWLFMDKRGWGDTCLEKITQPLEKGGGRQVTKCTTNFKISKYDKYLSSMKNSKF